MPSVVGAFGEPVPSIHPSSLIHVTLNVPAALGLNSVLFAGLLAVSDSVADATDHCPAPSDVSKAALTPERSKRSRAMNSPLAAEAGEISIAPAPPKLAAGCCAEMNESVEGLADADAPCAPRGSA